MLKQFLFFVMFALNISMGLCLAGDNDTDKIVESIENAYKKVNDYSCTMYKKEFIEGKYVEQKNITYKHKKPNKYYMKWNDGDDKGMEVIYAGKKYGNQLYVHSGGTFSFLSTRIDPKGGMAMSNNRHSILESDYGYIVGLISKNFSKARADKEGKFTVDDSRGGDGVEITAEFPEGKGYYAGKIVVFLDRKLNLPTQFKVFDWKGKLLESYKYTNIKINPGLKDIDFDIDNPEYNY